MNGVVTSFAAGYVCSRGSEGEMTPGKTATCSPFSGLWTEGMHTHRDLQASSSEAQTARPPSRVAIPPAGPGFYFYHSKIDELPESINWAFIVSYVTEAEPEWVL